MAGKGGKEGETNSEGECVGSVIHSMTFSDGSGEKVVKVVSLGWMHTRSKNISDCSKIRNIYKPQRSKYQHIYNKRN